MSYDRIAQVRISGMRCIAGLALDLRGLTVLIGENGSGKSTLLEAFELLRQAAKPVNYVSDILEQAHGGLRNLLRRGARSLRLGVTVEGNGPRLTYDLELSHVGTAAEVVGERLDVYQDAHAPEPLHALVRAGDKARIFDVEERKLVEKAILGRTLAVSALGIAAQPAFQRLTEALERIELHVPFETRPVWQERQLEIRTGPRWPSYVAGSQSLARYGLNLPNCFYHIRNLGDEVWDRIRDRVRLGLGADFRDLRLPSSQPGHIDLEVVFGSAPDRPLPLASLSEGQISYLAFVALVELNPGRSALTFDEPEVHLHPAMLARVAGMLEEVAETCPVLLATHSDRLLDALATPEKDVVLCDLDGEAATRLKRPNPERLAAWLESYRGFGSIRAEGYEAHLFDDEPAPSASREHAK